MRGSKVVTSLSLYRKEKKISIAAFRPNMTLLEPNFDSFGSISTFLNLLDNYDSFKASTTLSEPF